MQLTTPFQVCEAMNDCSPLLDVLFENSWKVWAKYVPNSIWILVQNPHPMHNGWKASLECLIEYYVKPDWLIVYIVQRPKSPRTSCAAVKSGGIRIMVRWRNNKKWRYFRLSFKTLSAVHLLSGQLE